MKCQHCEADLEDRPMEAVEEDVIDEVVVHIEDGDEPFMVAKRSFYCDPECFANAVLDGAEVEP